MSASNNICRANESESCRVTLRQKADSRKVFCCPATTVDGIAEPPYLDDFHTAKLSCGTWCVALSDVGVEGRISVRVDIIISVKRQDHEVAAGAGFNSVLCSSYVVGSVIDAYTVLTIDVVVPDLERSKI